MFFVYVNGVFGCMCSVVFNIDLCVVIGFFIVEEMLLRFILMCMVFLLECIVMGCVVCVGLLFVVNSLKWMCLCGILMLVRICW